jgi:[NiFe] hydrogenase assembly HybE family chaperone
MESQTNLERLEPAFQSILENRMSDVPVINERLMVKAIGFEPWHEYQLGILVTPWFMNLLLLPESSPDVNRDENKLKIGEKQTHVFPSGAYEFIVGFEEGLGFYLSCSLFSPMFEFEDQQAAELTAKEALVALMDIQNEDVESQQHSEEIAQIWSGEKPRPEKTAGFESQYDEVEEVSRKTLSERVNEPTSRRDFLRGKVFTEDANK